MKGPYFLRPFVGFPASPMAAEKLGTGKFHPNQEIHALLPCLVLTGKSTAGGFNFAATDIDAVLRAIIQRQRFNAMGNVEIDNNTPDVVRDRGVHRLGFDACQLDPTVVPGQPVNAVGGAAQTWRIYLNVPFMDAQKENPNILDWSGGQLRYEGTSLYWDLVAGINVPLNVVLSGGTVAFSAIAGEVYALVGSIRPYLWMAPAVKMFQRAANNPSQETQSGPIYLRHVFGINDPAHFENSGGNIRVAIDGRVLVQDTPVARLTHGYRASVRNFLTGAPSYDICSNVISSLGVAALSGRTPLLYESGLENPVESEWTVAGEQVLIDFASLGASPKLYIEQVLAMTAAENRGHFATMLSDEQFRSYFRTDKVLRQADIDALRSLDITQFAVHGGGSSGMGAKNDDNELFKPKIFLPRRG